MTLGHDESTISIVMAIIIIIIPSRYVTSQLGQLSLASLWGRLIKYQLRLG